MAGGWRVGSSSASYFIVKMGAILTFFPDIRANHRQTLNLVRNICECTHLPLHLALKAWKREIRVSVYDQGGMRTT